MYQHIEFLLRLLGKSPASPHSLRNLQAAFHADSCEEENSREKVCQCVHTFVYLCLCSDADHLVTKWTARHVEIDEHKHDSKLTKKKEKQLNNLILSTLQHLFTT